MAPAELLPGTGAEEVIGEGDDEVCDELAPQPVSKTAATTHAFVPFMQAQALQSSHRLRGVDRGRWYIEAVIEPNGSPIAADPIPLLTTVIGTSEDLLAAVFSLRQ